MYTKPDIKQLKLELDLAQADHMDKEAIEKEAAVLTMAGATVIAAALALAGTGVAVAGNFAGNVAKAAGSSLAAIGDLSEKGVGALAATSVGSGLAGAYLAYKMKKPRASDIDVDRSNLYKNVLKTKIMEIRRKQAIDADKMEKNQPPEAPKPDVPAPEFQLPEPVKENTLRLG